MPDTFNLGNVSDLSSQVAAAPQVLPEPVPGVPVAIPPANVPVPQVPAPVDLAPVPVPAQTVPVPAPVTPVTPATGHHAAGPGPGQLPASPDLDQFRTDVGETRKTVAELDKATAENEAAKVQALEAQAEEKRRQASEQLQKELDQKRARFDAENKTQQALNAAKTEPYHTFFEGKDGQRDVGRSILAALSVLAGSVSYSAEHHNQAAQIIQNSIAQNFRQQQEKHAELWKAAEMAAQGGRELRQDQLQEMADLRTRQASQLDAVIAQGLKMAGPSQARRDQMEAKLKSLGLLDARDQAVDESVRLHQAAAETRRHNKAQEGIEYSRLNVEKEKAGLGQNGSGLDNKTIQLGSQIAQRVRNGAQGKTLNVEENRLQQAQASLEAIKPGPDGKLNQVSAKEALLGYVRAVSGGVPTKDQEHGIINDLGGIGDKVKRQIQGVLDGGSVTPEDAQVIKSAIETQVRYRSGRVNALRKTLSEPLENHPALSRFSPEQRQALIKASGLGQLEGTEPAQTGPREGQTASAPGKPTLIFRGGKWQQL